jgi:hypothetical protein
VKVRLLLAHYAEVQANLLFALGVGWTEIGPEPSAFAIAALIEVTWDETNRPHELRFTIVDADGHALQVPTATGDRAFEVTAAFDVGRPPGVVVGRSFIVPAAINVTPMPFQPGRQYVIRAAVDGEPLDEVSILIRPMAGTASR